MALVERTAGSLADWLNGHRDVFEAHMTDAGALLLRGFDLASVEDFHAVARDLCGDIYTDNSEHTTVSADGTVQTPVPYAADRLLLWHNENSFNDEWPLRIAFCCVQPAEHGGETPIVDSCAVLRAIDPAFRDELAEKGVAYIRNFASGLGLSWQTVFRTDNRATVARYCHDHGIAADWSAKGHLRTVAVRPAIVPHPVTGELSLFAQPQHWHPACLDPGVRATLEHSATGVGFPRDCTFGDGSPIGDDEMRHLLDMYRRHQVVFPWRPGDLLVLDNVLWAHGRNPYAGRRTILVAMGSLYAYADSPAS